VLFTFPSRYWFTIGGQKYLALGGGPPGFLQGFSCPGVLGNSSQSLPVLPYGTVTVSGAAFQPASGNRQVSYSAGSLLPSLPGPTTPSTQRQQAMTRRRFRLFPVRSPLLGESRLLSLPRGTKMFQFPRLPPSHTTGSLPITEAGLPHSGISGSRPARGSPERIVVRHALHRLLAPRHPPVAYSSLTIPSSGTCRAKGKGRGAKVSQPPARLPALFALCALLFALCAKLPSGTPLLG
jgi:hypothetical protein